MLKALDVPKLRKKSSLKEPGKNWNQNILLTDNQGQNIREKL